MIKPEVLDAMLAAGCTAEQIVAAVKADALVSASAEPSAAAERMRRYRQRREELGMPQAFDGGKYRPAIAARDGEQCAYCAAEGRTEIDHVVPIIQGGTDDIDNLVFACRACNGKKSGRTPDEAGMKFSSESAHSAHVRYIERTSRTEQTSARTDASVSLSPVPLLSPHTPLITPLPPNPSQKQNSRGTRLPDDWQLTGPDLAYALSKGLTEREAGDLGERMKSWALSASGSNAVKRNWHQAYQGWVQRDGPGIIKARTGQSAKPLTEFQRKQQETNDVRAHLRNLAGRGVGDGTPDGPVLDHHGQRSAIVRDGAGSGFLELSAPPDRNSG